MSTSSRVIKNTTYLYIKMGITMFISLYSTRLILASLGASDFGIFNVIGGAIGMLGFLNSTLANATQRFMSFAEGQGLVERKRQIFNVSIVLHMAIACITATILVIAMYPFFHGIFRIDSERILAAKIIYLCLIFSTILTIINAPYDAVMNTHENMLYYSIVGVFESALKLIVALIIVHTTSDKLILYGILMSCIPLITLSIMKYYCHRHYAECVISPKRYWDGSLVKQLSSFFGWNFLTAVSSLFSAQGIGIVLNHFFGTVLNAAQGIANQVNGVLSNFSLNMMKALNPVITKNAGAGNINTMNKAVIVGCKFSALLTMLFAVPLSFEVNYVLNVWLKEVPIWANIFVIMQLIQSVITQMGNSAATSIYSCGDIKHYAIYKSVTNAMPLLITWIAFQMGGGPIWLYIPMIIVWGIGGNIVIAYFAEKKCGFKVKKYLSCVVLPVVGTALIMISCGLVSVLLFNESLLRFVTTCVLTSISLFLSVFIFAISDDEKTHITSFVNNVCKKMLSH